MAAKHLKTGEIGEKTALKHLERHGFSHIESNFRARSGEIDLIVEKDGIVHFIEVKTVSRGTTPDHKDRFVPHGTYRPEENVHPDKLRKVLTTIQIWLLMNRYEGDWQLDVAAVKIDPVSRRGLIRIIENVIRE